MESPARTEIWTENGRELLSRPYLNFCARRRVAISLVGFIGLASYNLGICRTIPVNPFDFADPLAMTAMLVLGGGLMVRSWSAGTLNKSREVTQVGPYALSRNPLYLGSFAMMIAFCMLLQDALTLLFVLGPMSFLYWLQITFEEKRLVHLFPNDWEAYTNRVPRVFPRFWTSQALKGWTVFEWMRNREYKALLASLCGVIAIYAWHRIGPGFWQ